MIEFLENRKSVREFGGKLDLIDLNQILELSKKTATAGGIDDINIKYFETNDSFLPFILNQKINAKQYILIYGNLCGDKIKKYGLYGISYLYQESGAIMQNFDIIINSLGGAICPIGGFHREALMRHMKLDGLALLLIAFGKL